MVIRWERKRWEGVRIKYEMVHFILKFKLEEMSNKLD